MHFFALKCYKNYAHVHCTRYIHHMYMGICVGQVTDIDNPSPIIKFDQQLLR